MMRSIDESHREKGAALVEITVRDEQGSVVVCVAQRLDASTTPEFEKKCAEIISPARSHMVFDFTNLEYISSAGLRSILATAKKLQAIGGGLSLCGLSGLVEEVISVSGFDRVLPVYASVDDALRRDA
jgi:anti-anti-sigma factor